MMLDLYKLGAGLIVKISMAYESRLEPNTVPPTNRMILTNKYECDVLVEGTVYTMAIVVHFWPGSNRDTESYSRIEWQVINQDMWAKSGIAEVMWHNAKFI